ncbi:unnamed protein product [Urochloa humidicola]
MSSSSGRTASGARGRAVPQASGEREPDLGALHRGSSTSSRTASGARGRAAASGAQGQAMAQFPTAVERRGGGQATNRRRSRSPPTTASTLYFPPELIPEVARHLMSLQDFFALRAACRTYRTLLPLTPSNLASQAPLLLLEEEEGEEEDIRSFVLFHPTLRRFHRFRLHAWPYFSFGCRLLVGETEGLSIVNLLTGERAFLSRPTNKMCSAFLYGDLVLSLTTWQSDMVNFGSTIAYCRFNATDWRVASITEPYSLEALVCVNGVLYALVYPGYILATVELSENKDSVELVLLGGNLDASIVRIHEEYEQKLHLVDCCGELLLVSAMEMDPRVYHVFRWKFAEAKWERITSLGGCTLFLAKDRFVGCLGPHHKGNRGDSIYITEWYFHNAYYYGDWYEYSLDDGSFNRFFAECSGAILNICTLWVLPSMY